MTEHYSGATSPVLTGLPSMIRKISNSEVATWLNCRRKYYYEHDLNLEPIQRGDALGRGILLHEVLAHYYTALKHGNSHDSSAKIANEFLSEFLASPNYKMETVLEVRKLVTGYWALYQGDPDWEILEVEQTRALPLNDDFEYDLKFDLLVRVRSQNKIALVDHKTAYNFWTQDKIELNAQFPKYIGTLRANATQVDKVIINQLRTRSLKSPSPSDLYKRVDCVPSRMKIANMMREQIIVSQEINKHRQLPIEVRSATSPRNINPQICDWCDSKPLCMSELDGGDVTTMIATDYKQNTYGRNFEPSKDEL